MENLELNEKTTNMEGKIEQLYKTTSAADKEQQDDYATMLREFRYKVLPLAALSDEYKRDLFPLMRALRYRYQPDIYGYKRVEEAAMDLNNISDFRSYDSKKLAIIFDLYDTCNSFTSYGYLHNAVGLKDIYSKFSPDMTDDEFIGKVSKITTLAKETKKNLGGNDSLYSRIIYNQICEIPDADYEIADKRIVKH